MKSQRRHDLQENELAKRIVKIPSFFDVYGNKILIAIIVISLIVIVVRWRWNAAEQSLYPAREALNNARNAITELRSMGVEGLEPQRLASARTQYINDTRNAIEGITSDTEDRHLLAEATLARGDLYWTIANLPDLPGAATQESLRPDVPADKALETAETSYKAVVDQYPEEKLATISAPRLDSRCDRRKPSPMGSRPPALRYHRQRRLHPSRIPSIGEGTLRPIRRSPATRLHRRPATRPAAEATTLPAEAGLGPRATPAASTLPAPTTATTTTSPATKPK